MSDFCGIIDRHIQETCIKYLLNYSELNIWDVVPCQDGFMILFDHQYVKSLTELEQVVCNKVGLPVELAVKDFNDVCEIPINETTNIEQYGDASNTLVPDSLNIMFSNDKDCGFQIYFSLKDNTICCNSQTFIKKGSNLDKGQRRFVFLSY